MAIFLLILDSQSSDCGVLAFLQASYRNTSPYPCLLHFSFNEARRRLELKLCCSISNIYCCQRSLNMLDAVSFLSFVHI